MSGPTADVFACRRNAVVIASAGTGKTFTLVGMIVHLLLGLSETENGDLRPPADPRTIVATTFSRRAAVEIRGRLVSAITELAEDPERSPFYALLASNVERAFANGGVKALRARAQNVLAKIRDVDITTLHGLAHRLIVAHGARVGLAEFELQSPGEHALFVETIAQEILERRSVEAPKDLARALDATGGLEALMREITKATHHALEMGFDVDTLTIPDDRARIEQSWGLMLRLVAGLDTPRFERAVSAIRHATARGSEVSNFALRDLFAVAARGKVTPEERAFFDFRGELPGTSSRDKADRLWQLYESRALLGPFSKQVRSLVGEITREYERRARALSLLGFSDLVRLARNLLRDQPGVATQAGREMSWLFVDEAQDTSPIQRDLLLLLWAQPGTRKAGAVPTFADIRPQGLVVVGDRKQSIYQFRGADVAVFAEVCVGLAGGEARRALAIPAAMTWEPETPTADLFALQDNRRGTPALLAFANGLSRDLFVPELDPPALFEIRYQPETEDLRAVLPAPSAEEGGDKPAVVWHRVGGDGAASRLATARIVVDVVLRELDAGAPIRKTKAKPTPGDIAILAPTNEMLSACEFALAERDIPYTVAGRNFFESDEVVDALSMLELIIDPEDPTALATVLRGPWLALHDSTLLALVDPTRGLIPPSAFAETLVNADVHAEDAARLAQLATFIAESHLRVAEESAANLLASAIDELELEPTLRMLARGRERVANVEKLLAMACEHPEPRAFCRYVRTHAERGTRESEAELTAHAGNTVRLLTVHASKGLDFPIVIVPEVDVRPPSRPRPFIAFFERDGKTNLCVRAASREGIRIEPPTHQDACREGSLRERAERQRLWYVAITRATDRMAFVGRSTPKAKAGTSCSVALDALLTKESAYLSVDDVGPVPAILGTQLDARVGGDSG